MSHMFKPNLALVTSRMTKGESFAHAFVSRLPVEVIFLSSKTSNNAFVFPLKYYSDLNAQFRLGLEKTSFLPNFSVRFLAKLAQSLGLSRLSNGLPQYLSSDSIFSYIYSILFSPTYRTRYAEFLKVDYPRIPLTCSIDLFRELAVLGAELVELHLMESPKLEKLTTRYSGQHNPTVDKVSYANSVVWLDKAQSTGFRGVPQDVWDFHIGGYQVCDKWLKDRKGRQLSADDIIHYQRIVVALHETIRLMGEIDAAIDQHGGWPIK
jgi:predicted helicase